MSRILITGGAGFIGSNLAKRLVDDGHKVVVIDSLLRGNKIDGITLDKITFIKADVRDYEAVLNASKGCDVIFHFAAVLGVDVVADNPVETMDVETIGMRNVASAAQELGINKLLYASTSGIYGHLAMEQAVTETITVDPTTSYAMAKRYNEIYLASLQEEKGIKCIAIRFFNVYGHNQDNRMVIPRFIEQAKAGNEITVYGNGEQTRDFTFIDDTIESCVRLMDNIDKIKFEIFNVAHEVEGSIKHLANTIKTETNSNSEIIFLKAPKKRYDYEVGRRVGSSQKLFDFIQYKPETSLVEGLNTFI
jgi:UDP-glucuronate decarboxylase